jgi:hypothetical protein
MKWFDKREALEKYLDESIPFDENEIEEEISCFEPEVFLAIGKILATESGIEVESQLEVEVEVEVDK